MKSSIKNKAPVLVIIGQALKYSWQASKWTLFLLAITSFIMGIVEILQIVWLQKLFDEITLIINANNENTIFLISCLLSFVFLVRPFVELAQYLVQGHFWRRGTCYLQCLYHEKVSKFNLIDFEYSETYDQMRKVVEAIDYAPSVSRSVIELSLCYIPFFLFTVAYIGTIKKVLIITLIFMLIPCIVANMNETKMSYNLRNETVNLKRKMEGFEKCICAPVYFKETRTLNAVSFFMQKLRGNIAEYNSLVLKRERRVLIWNLGLQVMNVLGYSCSLLLLVVFLYRGEISIGAFASIFYSMERLSGLLETFIRKVSGVVSDSSAASFLVEFLLINEELKSDTELPKDEDIVLENVSFNYPNSLSKSLDEINIRIKKGETIAIVGENGAGKSTLAKVIMGLYQPTTGCVKYGNNDLSLTNNDNKFKGVSAVFQDFQRYKLMLDENIRIADFKNDASVTTALSRMKVEEEKIQYWKDHILSKEYGGIDLSGGEWQRIAMARGLHKEHQIIVLDEPTSAIDPIEEYNVFHLFMELADTKTAFIITHRVGAARLADRIIVLDSGKIQEIGTHQELMELKGLYYTMFMDQSGWYYR